MQLAVWMLLLHDASRIGCRNVQFTGGEPLPYSSLATLIREAGGSIIT